MKHKDQIRMIQESRQRNREFELLRSQRAIIMLILADKFGFRKPRLDKFMEELFKVCDSYVFADKNGDTIYTKEIEDTLLNDYGFDMKKYL